MGSRFDPSDRHNDDLIEAVNRASHMLNETLKEGFKLLAAELKASNGTDNSAAIETEATRLRNLTSKLNQSTS
jgi:hypothetical protein